MAITKTTQVARTVALLSGAGTFRFNDKLVDGRRSLKVWGWSDAEYRMAKGMLEDMGCKVEVVQTPVYRDRIGVKRTHTRLHVTE